MSISVYAVSLMGGTPFHCHITEYMRTIIYRIHSFKVQGGHLTPCVVKEADYFKASVVTNPVEYLSSDGFSNQRSVDWGFEGALKGTCEGDETREEKTVFVIVQFKEDIESFPADKGQCTKFENEGRETYLIFDCVDAPAPIPDEKTDIINIVLTAVKAELDVTEAVEKVFDNGCYVSAEGLCIHKGVFGASARGRLVSPIALEDLTARAQAIRVLITRIEDGIELDRIESLKPEVDNYGARLKELIEALQLDPSLDSAYRRLWFLLLWERVNEFRRLFARRQRPPELRNNNMEAVNKHRHAIAHRKVDELDGAMSSSLQKKVFGYFKQHL